MLEALILDNYQSLHRFSWDSLFRPRFMSRLLSLVGLRKHAILILFNLFAFVVVITVAIPYLFSFIVAHLIGGRRLSYPLTVAMGALWLASFGVYRRCWYHPDVDGNSQQVFMVEHFSLLDIPIYHLSFPSNARALSAKEYARVPIYGWLLKTAGTQFIERRNRIEAIADLNRLQQKMVRDNLSVFIAPTGTRSPRPEGVPYKRGVFYFAVTLQKPIVPTYMIGMENLCMGGFLTKPGRVDVVFGAPITPALYPDAFADVDKLLMLVRDRMEKEGAYLRQNRQQLMQGKLSQYNDAS